jgi:hypothetical protein
MHASLGADKILFLIISSANAENRMTLIGHDVNVIFIVQYKMQDRLVALFLAGTKRANVLRGC